MASRPFLVNGNGVLHLRATRKTLLGNAASHSGLLRCSSWATAPGTVAVHDPAAGTTDVPGSSSVTKVTVPRQPPRDLALFQTARPACPLLRAMSRAGPG